MSTMRRKGAIQEELDDIAGDERTSTVAQCCRFGSRGGKAKYSTIRVTAGSCCCDAGTVGGGRGDSCC